MINGYIIYDDFYNQAYKYLCRSTIKLSPNMGLNSEILAFDVWFWIAGLPFHFERCPMYLVKLVSISVVRHQIGGKRRLQGDLRSSIVHDKTIRWWFHIQIYWSQTPKIYFFIFFIHSITVVKRYYTRLIIVKYLKIKKKKFITYQRYYSSQRLHKS